MKQVVASVLAFCAFIAVNAQTGVPGQISTSFVQVRDYGASGGPVTRPCMLFLPSNYSHSSTAPPIPLIVYFHGHGERGNPNGSNVNALKLNSPFKYLDDQSWDGSVTYGAPCHPGKFAVFAFQSDEDFSHAEIEYALQQLYLRFRLGQIVVTGPSGGGGTTFSYAMDYTRFPRATHMIPMSVPAASFTNVNTLASTYGMKVWAFADDAPNVGSFYTTTTSIVSAFNNAVSNSARFTGRNLGHCCWEDYYDPDYRETDNDGSNQSVNIYDWAMKRLDFGIPYNNQCGTWYSNPYRFAGYITTSQTDKVGACNNSVTQPIYSNDGTVAQGKTLYSAPYGGTYFTVDNHWGYTTTQLKGAPADKHLVMDSLGYVSVYENCISPAGYVSSGFYSNPAGACSASCSTQVYSNAGVVAQGIKLYASDGVTPFVGSWADYGFTTTQYGTAQKRLNIDNSGNILEHANCGGGGQRRPMEETTEASVNASLQIFPNPASNTLNIRLPATAEQVNVNLYNMKGVLVYQARINGQQHVIQTAKFARGVYLLQLTTQSGKKLQSKKITLQ
jgi:hypothetical protein